MQIQTRPCFSLIGCIFVLAAASAAQEHHPEHAWDYGETHGPSHWGQLSAGLFHEPPSGLHKLSTHTPS